MRTFAVIGLSTFGYYLTKYLADRGFKVLAIDADESKIEKISAIAFKAVIADARDKNALEALGITDFDVVIVSLGDQIDASVLVTLYLKELGVKEIIAKASTEDHGKILDRIGASTVIFPERDVAFRLARSLENVNILDAIPFSPGITILEFAPPNSFLGKTLKELDIRNRFGIQIIIIKELVPENLVVVPTPDHRVKDSDILVGIGKDEDFEKLLHEN
ncbi:MAG: TrkA family potassium uptake protein [candidate division KSB1 bacterium]|nr:TrkA family potassium uptake protein [candidate division KSB1 bacterium]MDZ7318960.1 TrkA family potassium uptake protein [candidate division KSB1 bacterium]MDZ7341373.1 TrkA family potassium uptake protein [candidate division KSB1 bacterium]